MTLDEWARCINCDTELEDGACPQPFCKMNRPKLEKNSEKFLRALNCPQVTQEVDNYIENEIDRQIETKRESEIEAQVDSELSDYMQGFWARKGE